uniref:Putative secreted protein n=1 Tax=Anopheles darlingi TaxID=43151 RepID=A0A2M4DES7_ANODA
MPFTLFRLFRWPILSISLPSTLLSLALFAAMSDVFRSTCRCSINRQNEALRSYGTVLSDMQRRIRSISRCGDRLFSARYCRLRHMFENRFSW